MFFFVVVVVTFEVSYVPFHAVILLLPGGNHYTKSFTYVNVNSFSPPYNPKKRALLLALFQEEENKGTDR